MVRFLRGAKAPWKKVQCFFQGIAPCQKTERIGHVSAIFPDGDT
jgi:hypothetical protein